MLFPVKVKAALVGLVVAGGAVASVALGPAGPAVGQSSQPTSSSVQVHVAVHSPATLVADGAEVDVPVTANCSGPDLASGFVQVTLTEAVNGDIATGFGSVTVDCTGTSQTADVVVVAQTSSGTGLPTTVPWQEFTRGPAIADTFIQACPPSGCTSTTLQEIFPVINIGK